MIISFPVERTRPARRTCNECVVVKSFGQSIRRLHRRTRKTMAAYGPPIHWARFFDTPVGAMLLHERRLHLALINHPTAKKGIRL